MARINRLVIDETGDIDVEFSCYEGNACRVEEDKLRRTLAELGLAVEVEWLKPKSSEQTAAEVRNERQKTRRKVVKT